MAWPETLFWFHLLPFLNDRKLATSWEEKRINRNRCIAAVPLMFNFFLMVFHLSAAPHDGRHWVSHSNWRCLLCSCAVEKPRTWRNSSPALNRSSGAWLKNQVWIPLKQFSTQNRAWNSWNVWRSVCSCFEQNTWKPPGTGREKSSWWRNWWRSSMTETLSWRVWMRTDSGGGAAVFPADDSGFWL